MSSVTERYLSPWPRWLVIFGLILGLLMLMAAAISEPTAENLTSLLAIPGSGLYTLALYLTRRWWLPLLARHPLRNAMLLGIANAAVIETLFWLAERLMGATGVAASDNLRPGRVNKNAIRLYDVWGASIVGLTPKMWRRLSPQGSIYGGYGSMK